MSAYVSVSVCVRVCRNGTAGWDGSDGRCGRRVPSARKRRVSRSRSRRFLSDADGDALHVRRSAIRAARLPRRSRTQVTLSLHYCILNIHANAYLTHTSICILCLLLICRIYIYVFWLSSFPKYFLLALFPFNSIFFTLLKFFFRKAFRF